MDYQLAQGKRSINIQKPCIFTLRRDAEPRLHRDTALGQSAERAGEEALELVGEGEEARALALGGDGAAGAAEVEVDLAVSALEQLAGGPDEVVRVPAEQLRDEPEPGVVRREQLADGARREDVLMRWGEEGREVFVDAAEDRRVRPPPGRAGDALHGRGIDEQADRSFIVKSKVFF